MRLTPETFEQLNTLFQGTMSNKRSRDSFVTPILYHYPDIFGNINWEGNEREFFVGLIKQLVDYSEVIQGKQALIYFLEWAKNDIGGVDKQEELNSIITELSHQADSSDQITKPQDISIHESYAPSLHHKKWYEIFLNKYVVFSTVSILIIVIVGWLISAQKIQDEFPPPKPDPTSINIPPTSTPKNTDIKLLYPPFPLDVVNPYRTSEGDLIHTSALILEPLANIDTDGNLVPKLAARIPSIKNGGIIDEGRAVIWKLKSDVYWSDGTPVTAKDVVFTYRYCTQGQLSCRFQERFSEVSAIDALDDATVRIEFEEPTLPFQAFVSSLSPILQEKQFLECMEEESKQCNNADAFPIGTGPYVRLDYLDNDTMSFVINDRYRNVSKVYFSRIFMRIEENRSVASRAVLETGEADYARLISFSRTPVTEKKGLFDISYGIDVFYLAINHTNPNPTNDKESSVWYSDDSNPHPILSEQAVIKAMSAAIDRKWISQFFGWPTEPICDLIPNPPLYASSTNMNCMEATADDAQDLLKQAGWIDLDQDGVLEKNGFRLNLRLLTINDESLNDVSQWIRRAWKKIGIDTEIVQVDDEEFYGLSGPALSRRFDADILLYGSGADNIMAIDRYLSKWQCTEIPTPPKWEGENIARWCNEDYDAKLAQLKRTMRLDDRAAIVQEMNDMLVYHHQVIIPLVNVGYVFAYNNELSGANPNFWDVSLSNISEWRYK